MGHQNWKFIISTKLTQGSLVAPLKSKTDRKIFHPGRPKIPPRHCPKMCIISKKNDCYLTTIIPTLRNSFTGVYVLKY